MIRPATTARPSGLTGAAWKTGGVEDGVGGGSLGSSRPLPPLLQPPRAGRGGGRPHRCLGSCSVPAPAPSHLSAPVRVNKSLLLGFISSERPCIISADKGNIPLNDKPWESTHAYCITSSPTLGGGLLAGAFKDVLVYSARKMHFN